MKYLITLAILFTWHCAFAQQIRVADTLAPEDLGIFKWILNGSPNDDEVFIIRQTRIESRDKEISSTVYDTVYYSPDKEISKTILYINAAYFNSKYDGEEKWQYRNFSGSEAISGRPMTWSSSVHKIEITFQEENEDKTTMIFQVYLIPYAEAATLYEKLPVIESNRGWGWGAHFENGSEPMLPAKTLMIK